MKVTIITPSLNQAEFLEETIKSVIYQEGDFDLEYIIIDGESTDGSVDIIKHYDALIRSPHFAPRCTSVSFQWASHKNSGQSQAINKGFKRAHGDIMNWLGSDDLLLPGALQAYVSYFKEHTDASVVTAHACRIDSEGKRIFSMHNKPVTRHSILQVWKDPFPLHQPTAFIRKCVIDECGALNEANHLCMDYEWYLKIINRFSFHFIAHETACLRYHPKAKSIIHGDQQLKDACRLSRAEWGKKAPLYILSFTLYRTPQVLWKISAWVQKHSPVYATCVKKINTLRFKDTLSQLPRSSFS
jgi:glycosyltransferase involved in cell wall biosynthesis